MRRTNVVRAIVVAHDSRRRIAIAHRRRPAGAQTRVAPSGIGGRVQQAARRALTEAMANRSAAKPRKPGRMAGDLVRQRDRKCKNKPVIAVQLTLGSHGPIYPEPGGEQRAKHHGWMSRDAGDVHFESIYGLDEN